MVISSPISLHSFGTMLASAYTYRVILILILLFPHLGAAQSASASTVESCVDTTSGGGVCSGAEEKAKDTFDAFGQWIDDKCLAVEAELNQANPRSIVMEAVRLSVESNGVSIGNLVRERLKL